MDYVKNNDKYLEGVALNDDEDSIINFSKSETVSTFLENGKSNWDNHGGGGSKTLFSNLQLNVVNDVFIFGFTIDKTSLDYPDYAELQVNANGTRDLYSYGSPRDGRRMDTTISFNVGPSKFMSGTKLTAVVYSANGESASVGYNI